MNKNKKALTIITIGMVVAGSVFGGNALHTGLELVHTNPFMSSLNFMCAIFFVSAANWGFKAFMDM